ncbi:MAG: ThiF family adenylyltransferase [Lachnospiraceae bacterium]
MKKAEISSIYRYDQKGAVGQEEESVKLLKGQGIEGDIHCTGGERQISLSTSYLQQWIDTQAVKGLCFSRWKCNLWIDGRIMEHLSVGTRLKIGTAILEITVQEKRCFPECPRLQRNMKCELLKGCCFAKVVQGGIVKKKDPIIIDPSGWKRYERQMNIPQLRPHGQEKLLASSVLVIGAGGLGVPVITALAEVGIGKIGIIDGDVVEETNLNRQFFYTPADIGKKKAQCAGKWLEQFQPDCEVKIWDTFLTEKNGRELIKEYDMIVTAVDSIEVRLLVNHMVQEQGIPLVDGAIDGFYGQVTAVLTKEDPCLSCVNPEGKAPKKTAHSLGTTTMIIGALQAQIVIAYLAGMPIKYSHILSYDGLYGSIDEVVVLKNKNCKACGDKTECNPLPL